MQRIFHSATSVFTSHTSHQQGDKMTFSSSEITDGHVSIKQPHSKPPQSTSLFCLVLQNGCHDRKTSPPRSKMLGLVWWLVHLSHCAYVLYNVAVLFDHNWIAQCFGFAFMSEKKVGFKKGHHIHVPHESSYISICKGELSVFKMVSYIRLHHVPHLVLTVWILCKCYLTLIF